MMKLLVMSLVVWALTSAEFSLMAANTQLRNARNLIKEKRYDEAIELFHKMISGADNPKDQQYYVELAINAAWKGKISYSIEKFADMIKDPKRRSYIYIKFLAPGQVIEKTASLDLTSMPDDIASDAFAHRGIAFSKLKDDEKALHDFRTACDIKGGSTKGLAAQYAGDIYMKRGETELAKQYYKMAVDSTPGAFTWRCNTIVKLSELLMKDNEPQKALTLFSDDLLTRANNYNRVNLYSAKADLLQKIGRKADAVKALEAAIKYASGKQKDSLKKRLHKLAEDMM